MNDDTFLLCSTFLPTRDLLNLLVLNKHYNQLFDSPQHWKIRYSLQFQNKTFILRKINQNDIKNIFVASLRIWRCFEKKISRHRLKGTPKLFQLIHF